MPRWFKLSALGLVLWAWWAVERIGERHAPLLAAVRAGAGDHQLQLVQGVTP